MSTQTGSACDVLILGGGISGISTALILQSLGWRPAVLAEHAPRQAAGETEYPLIATAYAMASAYPHNLRVENLEAISAASQAVFGQLQTDKRSGVHLYRLFEIFEEAPPAPPLSEHRMNFRSFQGTPASLKASLDPPCRPGAEQLFGWSFDTYFADMPKYLEFLWQLFEERGGTLQQTHCSIEQLLAQAPSLPIVNCLGYGAIQSFNDRSPAIFMRGQQVIAAGAPMVTASDGIPLSYNYTPTADVFARADGNPEYVHFFPRSDGWVLGQTREPGILDEHGDWQGEAVKASSIDVSGVAVPEPIVELNLQLLNCWKNITTDRQSMRARTGYRYYRDPSGSGVRLEAEQIRDSLIIHNYGHGGSGITMSWGCSLRAAALLQAQAHGNARGAQYSSAFDNVVREQLAYLQ